MPPSRPCPRFNRNTRAADYISPAGPHGRDVHGEEVGEVNGAGVEGVHVVIEGDWETSAALTGREVVAGLCGARRSDAVVKGYCDGGGEGEGAEDWEDGGVEHPTPLFELSEVEATRVKKFCRGNGEPACTYYFSRTSHANTRNDKLPGNQILTPLTVPSRHPLKQRKPLKRPA